MTIKFVFRLLLSVFMIGAGISHFLKPEPFIKIVPNYLPNPKALVYVSGAFEILGGIGLLVPGLSSAAAWGLILLFIAVFPANLNMALNNIPFGSGPTPQIYLWLRLPL